MPKNKKLESSSGSGSDSDSGPEDRNPPKKAKKADSSPPPKSSGSKPKKSSTEDDTWELDKKRVVKINEFRGRVFVDIREYYDDPKSGELKPGKKGISLSLEQYKKFKEFIPEIDEALKNK